MKKLRKSRRKSRLKEISVHLVFSLGSMEVGKKTTSRRIRGRRERLKKKKSEVDLIQC